MLEKYEKQLSELQEKYDACPKPDTLQRSSTAYTVHKGLVYIDCIYSQVQRRHRENAEGDSTD